MIAIDNFLKQRFRNFDTFILIMNFLQEILSINS